MQSSRKETFVGTFLYAWTAISLLVAAGCGSGGGGGGGGQSSSSATSASATDPVQSANVLSVSVDPGPSRGVNGIFGSVTICTPGVSSSCQTIDNVLIDTASVGLRLIASALPSALSLPPQSDASGAPVAECAHFATGILWGPVKVADVIVAGEQVSALPVQVIGDAAFSSIPGGCSSAGPARQTVSAIGANGILGLGVFRQDCGIACVRSSTPGIYYSCATPACQPIALALASQVQNPVAGFASDNNGIVLKLPAIAPQGATTVTGSLVFGIGTQANNGLGSASVFAVDARGVFATLYKGTSYTSSFMDSGSNGNFFQDESIPACGNGNGFYCPVSTLDLSATIQGVNGANANINFSVANANALFAANPGAAAFNNLAGPSLTDGIFDWGLPFFFGRNVYVAIEGASTPGGTGPYFAF